MANTLITIMDTSTGEEITRERTNAEEAQYQKDIAPVVVPELTPAEKLFAATGLTVAEYKALGL